MKKDKIPYWDAFMLTTFLEQKEERSVGPKFGYFITFIPVDWAND